MFDRSCLDPSSRLEHLAKKPAASYPFLADAAAIASETMLIARLIATPSFHNLAAAEYKALYPCAVRYR